MKLLLDTQIVVWWQLGNRGLSSATRTLIESNDEAVLVSRVTLWEVVLKSALGKIGIEPVPFSTEIERLGFRWLDIANDHILNVPQLPRFPDHNDPFDRLLIAQAQVESAVFLTADSTLARYGNVIRVV